MKILSIGKTLHHDKIDIISIELSKLSSQHDIETFDYIIINGGDGTIRRVLKQIHHLTLPPFILNPTGSFNVIAKMHRVPKVEKVLDSLANQQTPNIQTQKVYGLNDEVFLFSAGNMGDLQHIFLSETLRFGYSQIHISRSIFISHTPHHDPIYATKPKKIFHLYPCFLHQKVWVFLWESRRDNH